MTHEAPLLIGGESVVTGSWIDRENPAHPSEIAGRAAEAGSVEASAAVDAAAAAFPAWAALSPSERADALRSASASLREAASDIGAILCNELGKPVAGSIGEANFSVVYLEQAIEDAVRLQVDELVENRFGTSVIIKRPFGVVSAIVPWNAPLILAMLKIGPALATGNTMVVKPSPLSPLAITRAVHILASHLPPGVLNVVNGGAEVGGVLTTHEAVRKVAFTGGLQTATQVMASAAAGVKPVVLELGGNDPAIILDVNRLGDSDLDTLVMSTFATSGQVCIAIKRLYVRSDQVTEFVDRYREACNRTLVLGDPALYETTIGPVVSAEHKVFIESLVADAVAKGARAHRLGTDGAIDPDGYYVEPTLLTGCGDDDAVVVEEQFGPTVPLLSYDSVDEAITRANDSDLGLAASVWGGDPDELLGIARQLEVGTTFISSHNRFGVNPGAPFGGTKLSGFGREYGDAGVEGYLQSHAINTPASSGTGYPSSGDHDD